MPMLRGFQAAVPLRRPEACGKVHANRIEQEDHRVSKRFGAGLIIACVFCVAGYFTLRAMPPGRPLPGTLSIDYPPDGAVFPPDMSAPTFLWQDGEPRAVAWQIEVATGGTGPVIKSRSPGEAPQLGPLDPRCVGPTNKPPALTAAEAAAHTWKPDPATWESIKRASSDRDATVTVTGYADADLSVSVSRGNVTIRVSKDPVGAPIFYRDVPLMPSELEKGVIKPIAPRLLPYIAWRLRDVGEPQSRVVMEGIHTCANCHSFSRDGKTLGLDLDGPHNDKGLYAIVPVAPKMSIRDRDVISWKAFRDQTANDKRIGFMSQVSPDGNYVVTATQVEYYVANFKDYRFLQVFYPTRGILAWYDRSDGRMHALPGADDPRFVQANAVWSPDGTYLVFARAAARDAYPEGRKIAEYANDPNEVPIQYDLYRVPFNGGKGGTAVPIPGASSNGMSNSFPKVSPDGKWIVFVKCRNGQLMRPDGQLFIVPATGGEARRMRCNTPLMNSWHSFSPNGRWLVFTSKSRSPYTQMFLTHIDGEGNDGPAILIENATAANRAVNIPEFVYIPQGGVLTMDAPATEFYRLYDSAWDLTEKGQVDAAIAEWTRALALDPDDAKARNNFAGLLLKAGRLDEAVTHLRRVLAAKPDFTNARNNLGLALFQSGKVDEAVEQWSKSLEINPDSTEARINLGNAFVVQGRFGDAAGQWRNALELEPNRVPALSNLAWMLSTCPDPRVRDGVQAVELAQKALKLGAPGDPVLLDIAAAAYAEAGRFAEAVDTARRGLEAATGMSDTQLASSLRSRIALYESRKPFRDAPR
jgi:Flp pilus assembly protein TadD